MKNILLLGDLHCGSTEGLWHPDCITREGQKIKLSPLQEELYEKWLELQEKLPNYDAVFLMGDITHGLGSKEFGKDVIDCDLHDQLQCAVKLLKPIVENKRIVVISGSRYHSSIDYDIDRGLAEILNAKFGGAIANVRLKGTGIVINIAHGVGSRPVYLGTRMNQDIFNAILTEHLLKMPDVSIIIRAHFHIYSYFAIHNKHFIYIPGWNAIRKGRFITRWYFRQPDIGAVLLGIDEDNNINVRPYLFKLKSERKNIYVL